MKKGIIFLLLFVIFVAARNSGNFYLFINNQLTASQIEASTSLDPTSLYKASDTEEFYLPDSSGFASKLKTNESAPLGNHIQTFSSTANQNTLGQAINSVFSATTSNLDTGSYEVILSYTWDHDETSSDIIVDFEFDGNKPYSTTNLQRQEPGTATQKNKETQVFFVDVQAAGTKTLELFISNETTTANSSIQDIYLRLMRLK